MPEAAAFSQKPGRACTDLPDGDDRQVAETLCAGGAAGGSKGSSGLLQSGLAAEACAVSEGDAQRSTSWCPSSSKSSSVTGAGGDRSWSGGAARVPGETSARSPRGSCLAATAASGASQSSRIAQPHNATSACNEAGCQENLHLPSLVYLSAFLVS